MNQRTSQVEETETGPSGPAQPPAQNGEATRQPDVPEGDEEGG
jgi:hypothetical protein